MIGKYCKTRQQKFCEILSALYKQIDHWMNNNLLIYQVHYASSRNTSHEAALDYPSTLQTQK